MTCRSCDCLDCNRQRGIDRTMNRANDMDDDEPVARPDDLDDGWATPIHRQPVAAIEPANENQRKTWTAYAHRAFEHYKVKAIPLPTLASIICQECGVRPENFSTVSAMVAQVIKDCPDFELRKGKNGGVFRKASFVEGTSKLPAGSNQSVAVPTVAKLVETCTCKGCGTGLDASERSCWKCGAQQ